MRPFWNPTKIYRDE